MFFSSGEEHTTLTDLLQQGLAKPATEKSRRRKKKRISYINAFVKRLQVLMYQISCFNLLGYFSLAHFRCP